MKITQLTSRNSGAFDEKGSPDEGADAQLVLLFGARDAVSPALVEATKRRFPKAIPLGCSTAGEIAGRRVSDDTVVATALTFDSVRVHEACAEINAAEDSYAAGQSLVKQLPSQDLAHVFVLSDGLNVNGTALAKGMCDALPPEVRVTGGLSGDAGRFVETLVISREGVASRRAVAVGLYGDRLRVGFGSLGGWEAFGPERRVTKAKNNVLYELDGQSALGLYKQYLGHYATGLPASGLLFPLSVRDPATNAALTRTILAVDEATQSLVFAGDIPEGSLARLMHTNFDGLVDGASAAARQCLRLDDGSTPSDTLAILISCVGRKLVLKQRVEEEVDAVLDVLGERASATGFYSYGELAPLEGRSLCALHNQTMTVTTFREV